MVDLISLAIPGFFVLIGVELVIARIQRRKLYRLNDSINDLSCGIISEVQAVFTAVFTFGLYLLCYELGAGSLGFELPEGWWLTWVVGLLGVDFAYYWFHRWSHEINFLWAAHVVHHQSEEYNLSVALRQSAIQGIFQTFVFLPLALIGLPPLVYLLARQINTIYQFWIHTRVVGRLGPLEWVLNTPSHHRVHHGADPKYLDRNYAGMLIIWDRMFGSFQAEEEEPTYGTTKALASWNPIWANIDYWAQIARQARSFERRRDRLALWFKHPGWRPEQPVPTPPEVHGRSTYDADVSGPVKAYLFGQFVAMLVVTVGLLFAGDAISLLEKAGLGLWIVLSSMALGAGFEARRWFFALEALRLLALPVLGLWILPVAALPSLGVAALSLLGLVWTQRRGRGRPGERGRAEPDVIGEPDIIGEIDPSVPAAISIDAVRAGDLP